MGKLMNGSPILLGELLVLTKIVSSADIESSLCQSLTTGLPLGLQLVLMGKLELADVGNAVLAQSAIRDSLFPEKAVIEALSLSLKKKVTLKVAFDFLKIDFKSESKNRLGTLLADSEILDRAVLRQMLGLCKQSGLPLGRGFVASSILKSDILDKALLLQRMLRLGEIDRPGFIEKLESIKRMLDCVSHVSNSSAAGIGLDAFLCDANLLDRAKLDLAAPSFSSDNPDFEELVFRVAGLSEEVENAAKIIFKMITGRELSHRAGVDLLQRVHQVRDLQNRVQKVESHSAKISFSDFLQLTNIKKTQTEKDEFRDEIQNTDNDFEEAWKPLSSVAESIDFELHGIPNDLSDCLERNGFLNHVTKLNVVTAARQYKLYSQSQLNIDQALITYQLTKQASPSMSSWSGSFPSLAIWLPKAASVHCDSANVHKAVDL